MRGKTQRPAFERKEEPSCGAPGWVLQCLKDPRNAGFTSCVCVELGRA